MIGLKSNFGETNLEDFLTLIFIDLALHYQTTGKMSPEALKMAVKWIVRDYFYLGIADLKVFREKAISGEYGEVYNRFDTNVLLSWLKKYAEERCYIAESQSINESFSNSSRDIRTCDPHETNSLMDRLFRKLKLK